MKTKNRRVAWGSVTVCHCGQGRTTVVRLYNHRGYLLREHVGPKAVRLLGHPRLKRKFSRLPDQYVA